MIKPAELRAAATLGLWSGAIMLYLSTVGIVLAFAERNTVTGVLTLGRVMLAIPPLAVGYVAARKVRPDAGLSARLIAGLVAGAVGGVLLALGVLFASAVDVRDVLTRVSPSLIEFMEFGQGEAVGGVFNVAFGAVLGLIGAGLQVAAPRIRRPIIAGALGVVVGSMLEPFLRPRLQEFELGFLARLLYEDRGLSVASAIVVFALVAGAVVAWRPTRATVRRRLKAAGPQAQATVRWGGALLGILLLLSLPQLAGPLLSQVLVLVGLYVLLGLGLNIVVGYAGLLDLGYVAFYAVGSYLTALLTSPSSSLGWALPFWVALPIVVLGAAVTGLFIGAPVLRLRGDYLAIVTLGFGEIARILFLSDALKPWFGGTQGILSVAPIFGVASIDVPILGWRLSGPTLTYYPLLLFCIIAAFVAHRLKYSRTGRAWNAMREDEDVAEATGVSTVNYKLLAFALGASVGCLGGAVFSTHLQSVFPGSFNILVSITVLAIVILGGMGSIPGVVVGALALIGLPELLREFAEFKLLVYGAVLVIMMLLRPEGLIPDYVRRRELHDEGTDLIGGTAAVGTPAGGGGAS
jgi:branched-chain amino acid transport system permease protein